MLLNITGYQVVTTFVLSRKHYQGFGLVNMKPKMKVT